jgi:hypothetical protein
MSRKTYARKFKIIVHVPNTHTEALRQVLGDAGAGLVDGYSHCSFSYSGIGRYIPTKGTNPHIGAMGQYEEVAEDVIEVSFIPEAILKDVIAALKEVHPYEVPAFEIVELFDIESL